MFKTIPLFVFAAMFATCDPAARITCPPLKEYSDRTQQRLASEIRSMKGQYPTLEGFIADSKNLRDSVRTCKSRRDAQDK